MIPYFTDGRIELYNADCMEVLRETPPDTAGLVFSSPPYNVGKEYSDYKDSRPLEEYLDWIESVFKECIRILVPGGHLCIQVSNLYRSPYIPLSHYIGTRMSKHIMMRGEIIWDQLDSGISTAWGSYMQANSPALRDTHEYIEVFRKEGDRKGITDITTAEFLQYTKPIWRIPPQSGKKEIGEHPAAFPIALASRVIKLYSYIDEIVCDPFSGSGTTLRAAKNLKRRGLGIEISKKYCDTTVARLAQETM